MPYQLCCYCGKIEVNDNLSLAKLNLHMCMYIILVLSFFYFFTKICFCEEIKKKKQLKTYVVGTYCIGISSLGEFQ